MTDQSKPTTDMPDVIYADSHGIDRYWEEVQEFPHQVKYIRADLVPAAHTGNKAEVLQVFNNAIKSGKYTVYRDHVDIQQFPLSIVETIRAALSGDND